MATLEEKIKAKARELGYEACGIIEAGGFDEFTSQLDNRSSFFPHAASFYDNLRKLARPQDSVDWAKSIVVCVRRYDKYKIPEELKQFVGKVFLVDGRLKYAKEYANNVAFEQFLKDLGLQVMQNVAPARWSAVKAGLGKFRNNNFLYTESGSWLWVDTWVIDQEMQYEEPAKDSRFPCPEGCNKCVEACPTGALSAPLTMDATKCIACLTFRSHMKPDESLLGKMGTLLYGCDICQNVCPANAKTWQESATEFSEPINLLELITLENLFSMDEETYKTKLQPRLWYISEQDMWFWKVKVIRAMANENPQKYHEYFVKALEDSRESVREMARWALAKLN